MNLIALCISERETPAGKPQASFAFLHSLGGWWYFLSLHTASSVRGVPPTLHTGLP